MAFEGREEAQTIRAPSIPKPNELESVVAQSKKTLHKLHQPLEEEGLPWLQITTATY